MRLVINNLHPRGPWKARAWIYDWPSHNHSWAGGGATAKAHQPQRGDMFIARPNRNRRKPRRGGMVLSLTGHAAPTGLAEKIGGVVAAINMSLLRSWPNPAHALDGWIPSLLDAGHDRPAASDEHR